MGTGPLSLEVGEPDWIVPPGSEVFSSFEKDRTGVCFQFVGGYYVHGLTRGEADESSLSEDSKMIGWVSEDHLPEIPQCSLRLCLGLRSCGANS